MRIGWLIGRRRLTTALCLAVATGIGCSAEESKTLLNPEGPPDILQVFVTERLSDGSTALTPTYGSHPEFDSETEFEEGPDPSTPVMTAVADSTQKVRIIFDELIRGNTLEQFVCACNVAPASCPAGTPLYALDPSVCKDSGDTVLNEEGKWADANNDTVPDDAVLLPGVVSISCGTSFTWENTEIDGFYNPSGNQQVTVLGMESLGPALVLFVPALQTSADCTLTVAATVTDKQDVAVPSAPVTFHTEALAMLDSSPADGDVVDPTVGVLTVSFNAALDPASLTGVALMNTTTSTAVTGTAALDPGDATTITFTLEADLPAASSFELTIPATVTDVFGGALPQAIVITFTTA